MLTHQQKTHFAEQGYVVIPEVVAHNLISDAYTDIERIKALNPPPADRRGFHFYFLDDIPAALLNTLTASPALAIAESLIAPHTLEKPEQVQVSLNMPPWPHRPGGPHIDGLTPTEADGRPGTFSMLAGVFLTDQTAEDMGNLWVWPKSHLSCAEYLRENGPDALLTCHYYPPVKLASPVQVTGRKGDLLLAHYMLGHNMGGNMSDTTRQTLYFRLRRKNHRAHWREFVQDALYELAL